MGLIYKIINDNNGKYYIGQTTRTFDERQKEHENDLASGNHSNRALQEDWNRYGGKNFRMVTENSYVPDDQVLKEEQKLIKEAKNRRDPLCYND